MTLRAYDSWKQFAETVADAVIRTQAEHLYERQKAVVGLRWTYARARHAADDATWQDAVGILIEFARSGDWLAFNDLAHNYGVSLMDINTLWTETRKAYGLA
jgi:hypothetical protein